MGVSPTIFIDDQLETGTSWPVSLGTALGASRIIIPLWSGNYLSSKWCVAELSHMIARERETGLRSLNKPRSVIVPIVIHDGEEEKIPQEIRDIQRLSIKDYFNVRMPRNSNRAEQLDDALNDHAEEIAACIDSAPPWRKSWGIDGARELMDTLQRPQPSQTNLPRLGV